MTEDELQQYRAAWRRFAWRMILHYGGGALAVLVAFGMFDYAQKHHNDALAIIIGVSLVLCAFVAVFTVLPKSKKPIPLHYRPFTFSLHRPYLDNVLEIGIEIGLPEKYVDEPYLNNQLKGAMNSALTKWLQMGEFRVPKAEQVEATVRAALEEPRLLFKIPALGVRVPQAPKLVDVQPQSPSGVDI